MRIVYRYFLTDPGSLFQVVRKEDLKPVQRPLAFTTDLLLAELKMFLSLGQLMACSNQISLLLIKILTASYIIISAMFHKENLMINVRVCLDSPM